MTIARLLAVALLAPAVAFASRVKDLSIVEGGRDNQLVGYGIVVGLAGDGDSNAATTLRSVANLLQRYGLTIPASDIKAKNVAAVMITLRPTATTTRPAVWRSASPRVVISNVMIRLGWSRTLAFRSTSRWQELGAVADEVNPAIRNSVKWAHLRKHGRDDNAT